MHFVQCPFRKRVGITKFTKNKYFIIYGNYDNSEEESIYNMLLKQELLL